MTLPLRPFKYNEHTLQPLEVAVADSLDEFIAEKCLGMRGNIRGKRDQLFFKIRWAGYGPEDDTWEPWSYCRDSAAVRNYCAAHTDARVRRLVPADYVPAEPAGNRVNDSSSESSDDDI